MLLPSLHRLSLRDDVPTDSPFDMLSQDEIDEIMNNLVDVADPCRETLQAFCRSHPSADIHQTCERIFEALCRNPPILNPMGMPVHQYLCHGGAYNPYDSGLRYQWRRQFAMFCRIRWHPTMSFPRRVSANATLRMFGNPALTRIGQGVFAEFDSIDLEKLPDSILQIRREAFRHCRGITRMRLPSNLQSIGEAAFAHCTGMTSLDVADSVTDIYDQAFAYCTNLTTLSLPQNEQFVDLRTALCRGCVRLTTVVIPNSVKRIGSGAFMDCAALQTLTVPDSVEEIYDEAFKNCHALRQLQLSNDYQFQTIPAGLCWGCHALESITLTLNMYMIQPDAFRDCRSLREVDIPPSVMFIYARAFKGCTVLEHLYLPFRKGGGYMEAGAIEDCPRIRVYRGVFEIPNAYMNNGLLGLALNY